MVLPCKGSGEVETIRVSPVGVFGQRLCQHGIEVREFGSAVRNARWRGTQMVTDDDSAIRIIKRWRAGQQVKGRGSQRILIRSAVKLLTQQLLGGYVADRSQGHVFVSEIADVINSASDAEVSQ